MFELRMLGGASIEGPGGPLAGRVAQRRRLALLCVLARARTRPLSRDRLLGLFWPESDNERARHNLADSVYQIRKELGERSILTAGDDLTLNPEVVTSDAGGFEDALARGELTRAVSLYRGPFLEGFFLSDAPEFDRWVEIERDGLARTYAGVLEQLAEQAEARGDVKGSLEWWRRLATEDRFNAGVTLRLMEALAAAGDPAGALQQARVHAALLEQEFGAEPDAQVGALAERLRSGTAIPASERAETATKKTEAGASSAAPARETPPDRREPTNVPNRPRPVAARRIEVAWRSGRALGLLGVAVAAVFAVIWLRSETSIRPSVAGEAATAVPISIAVLPFVNLSRAREDDYFSDGLTEELIALLSQVRSLRVAARTSSFFFKGLGRNIREIGAALEVGTILEGSVRMEGDRVRVTAQLINVSDGFHLWSDTYEREGSDIFAIQSELALRIVEGLRAELSPAERTRLARRPTTSPAAYADYLKGRHFWNQRSSDGLARSIEFYERAIQTDPEFAAPYSGLAMTYSLQGIAGELTPEQARERMRAAVYRALELDRESAEAHAALGAYLSNYEWDSDGAERAYLRALELDPGYGTARHLYANLLLATDRVDEGVAQKRTAVELDPLAPQLTNSLGYALLEAGLLEEAHGAFQAVLELDSLYWRAHAGLGAYYEATGRLDEAIVVYQKVAEFDTSPIFRAALARALAAAGRRQEAEQMMVEVRTHAERTGIYSPAFAATLLALDDIDGALEWLERSYQQRHPHLRLIGRLSRLEGDPRYHDLRRRIGLAP